jgi:photosystem II stability/assembly factor-like uncharacterized protein
MTRLLGGFCLLTSLAAATLPARAVDTWTPLGPSGGTITAVAVDPGNDSFVYSGGRDGGVFRSADGGRSWQGVGLDGGVSRIGVAPATRAVFALTDNGFYRSTDFGASWSALGSPVQAAAGTPYVQDFAFGATTGTPGTVYAVALRSTTFYAAEILKSTDGGNSWSVVWQPPSSLVLLRVFADPTDPNTLYAGTAEGIYLSFDGGAHWTSGGFSHRVLDLAIERGPRHRLLAAVQIGDSRFFQSQIYASSDRGRTWRLRDSSLQIAYALALFAEPTPGSFVAEDTQGRLYRSTDAGFTWALKGALPRGVTPILGTYAFTIDPVRPGVAFAGIDGSRYGRGFWKTETYGAAWTPFSSVGLFAGDFVAVTSPAGDPETIWAGTGSTVALPSPLGIWTSPDEGSTWTQAAFPMFPVPAVLVLPAVPPAGNGSRIFAATQGAGLQKSTDGGRTWTRTALAANSVFALASPVQEPDTLYAIALRSSSIGLDVSLDGGTTWTTRPGRAGIFALAPGAPATLYENDAPRAVGPGQSDRLLKSVDRGATTTPILTVAGGFLSAIGLDSRDPQRIVVAYDHFDASSQVVSSILWTADGGATWNPGVLQPAPSEVFTLLADPLVPHGFLAGAANGAFASADGGATWAPLGNGLPRLRIHLGLSPDSPGTVYAATEGGGVYKLERTSP